MGTTPRRRLDNWLVESGRISSREKAKALILAGSVTVNGRVVEKAGTAVSPQDSIRVLEKECPYVGRGGLKLEGALRAFGIDVTGKTVLDAGSSTGGFTDCLLRHGVARVFAVDVGKGLLDWTLRSDPRVTLIEGKNIRYLTGREVPASVDLVTADLSFISLRLVLPVLARFLKPTGDMAVLVKPQFEAGKGKVGKGGIVRDPALHRLAVEGVAEAARKNHLYPVGVVESPIPGQKGNREFFLHLAGEPREGAGDSWNEQIRFLFETPPG